MPLRLSVLTLALAFLAPAPALAGDLHVGPTDPPLILTGAHTYGTVTIDGMLRLAGDTTITASRVVIGQMASVRTCFVPDAPGSTTGDDFGCGAGRSLTIKASGTVSVTRSLDLRGSVGQARPGGSLTIRAADVLLSSVDTSGVAAPGGVVSVTVTGRIAGGSIVTGGGAVTLVAPGGMDLSNVDASSQGAATDAGKVVMDSARGPVTVHNSVDSVAGQTGGTIAGRGGPITVRGTTVSIGRVTSKGAQGQGLVSAGTPGAVSIHATTALHVDTIDASGSDSPSGAGSHGGAVACHSDGVLDVRQVVADGGVGAAGGALIVGGARVTLASASSIGGHSPTGSGGNGGPITVAASGQLRILGAAASGGQAWSASPASHGGAGGAITLSAEDAVLGNGVLVSDGGASTAAAAGGTAGRILITSHRSLLVGGPLEAIGGSSQGGAAGAGRTIEVHAGTWAALAAVDVAGAYGVGGSAGAAAGSLVVAAHDLSLASFGGMVSRSGAGPHVDVTVPGSTSLPYLDLRGGADGVPGGSLHVVGGSLTIAGAESGNGSPPAHGVGAPGSIILHLRGALSVGYSLDASAQQPASGASPAAGSISIQAAGAVVANQLLAGGSSGSSVVGSRGGSIVLSAGQLKAGLIAATGGSSGSSAGGAGGLLSIVVKGASVIDIVDASGGAGSTSGGAAGTVAVVGARVAVNRIQLAGGSASGTGGHGGTASLTSTVADARVGSASLDGGTAQSHGGGGGALTVHARGAAHLAGFFTAAGGDAGGPGGTIDVIGSAVDGSTVDVHGGSASSGNAGTGGRVTISATHEATVLAVTVTGGSSGSGSGGNGGSLHVSADLISLGSVGAAGAAGSVSSGHGGTVVLVGRHALTVSQSISADGAPAVGSAGVAGGGGLITASAGTGTLLLPGWLSSRGGNGLDGAVTGGAGAPGGPIDLAGHALALISVTTAGGDGGHGPVTGAGGVGGRVRVWSNASSSLAASTFQTQGGVNPGTNVRAPAGVVVVEAAPTRPHVSGRAVRFQSNSPDAPLYGLLTLSGSRKGHLVATRAHGPLTFPAGPCRTTYAVVAAKPAIAWTSDAISIVHRC